MDLTKLAYQPSTIVFYFQFYVATTFGANTLYHMSKEINFELGEHKNWL